MLQGTKPHTIGFSLTDSPLGVLSWIYEKLHDWTDDYPWTDDEILTWVSIYYFSEAGPAAATRIYYESKHTSVDIFEKRKQFTDCPVGLSYFPKELGRPPMDEGKKLGRVVLQRRHSRGGHFAAWEVPDRLTGDVWEMFQEGGGAWDVVRTLANKQS